MKNRLAKLKIQIGMQKAQNVGTKFNNTQVNLLSYNTDQLTDERDKIIKYLEMESNETLS